MPLPPSFLFSVRYQRAKISGGGGGGDGNNAECGEGVAHEGRCNKVSFLPSVNNLFSSCCKTFIKLPQSPAKEFSSGCENFLRCPGIPWGEKEKGNWIWNHTDPI